MEQQKSPKKVNKINKVNIVDDQKIACSWWEVIHSHGLSQHRPIKNSPK